MDKTKMRRKDREVTDLTRLREILMVCKTCHVAMIDNNSPYIVPLSYGFELNKDELTLYFHSAYEGRKIDILRENPKVCFEISKEGEPIHAETPCNSGYYYSSIIGNGNIEFVEATDHKCKALSSIMLQQADRVVSFTEKQADTVCVYKLVTTDFTGKEKPKA